MMTIGLQACRVMMGETGTFVACAALAVPAAKRLPVSMNAIVAALATIARLSFRSMRFPFVSDRIMDSGRYRACRKVRSRPSEPQHLLP